MENQIFKVGDRVFGIDNGWGKVIREKEIGCYPIVVEFDSGKTEHYTLNGCRYAPDKNPVLSFTEYTLQGFSQERPVQLPEVDEVCLFKDKRMKHWVTGIFKGFEHDKFIDDNEEEWDECKRFKFID